MKLAKTFGGLGRVTPPAPDNGRNVTEVNWKDATTHFRVIERSDTACAFAYEDLATLGNLALLRPNKQAGGADPGL